MFKLTDVIPETYSDDIGSALSEINAHKRMTTEKRKLLEELKRLLKKRHYISFGGFSHRFHLSRIGTSYLYDVPGNKTGNIKRG